LAAAVDGEGALFCAAAFVEKKAKTKRAKIMPVKVIFFEKCF
jgi:hypothetical protein